jgi:serpin B
MDSVNVQMMALEGNEFLYFEDNTVQCISLPYTGNRLDMIILMPKTRDGLETLERKLSAVSIKFWLIKMDQSKVNVYLPKFKTTNRFMLKNDLISMGITDAFGDNADFSGMTGDKKLRISEVIHQAFINVDESGTEAAAATGVVMDYLAGIRFPEKHFTFRADHPFLYFIRDTTTGSILFLGRVINPVE